MFAYVFPMFSYVFSYVFLYSSSNQFFFDFRRQSKSQKMHEKNQRHACDVQEEKTGPGTTRSGYGTTFADAGVGIGLNRGTQKFDKKYELTDKAIN